MRCVVPGCNNPESKRAGIKVQLFPFPDDPMIRNRWILSLKFHPDWRPNGNNSRVCADHFTKDSFIPPEENRDKSGRLRKKDRLTKLAVPTILSYKETKPSRKPPMERTPPSLSKGPEPSTSHDTDDVQHMEHNEQISNDLSDEGVEAMEEDDQHMDEIKPARFSLNETQVDSLLAENPAGLCDINLENDDLVKSLERKISQLQAELNQARDEASCIHRIFRPDQISTLRGIKVSEWSDETVKDSIQLKHIIGTNGYQHLRKKGHPLPCISALNDRLRALF